MTKVPRTLVRPTRPLKKFRKPKEQKFSICPSKYGDLCSQELASAGLGFGSKWAKKWPPALNQAEGMIGSAKLSSKISLKSIPPLCVNIRLSLGFGRARGVTQPVPNVPYTGTFQGRNFRPFPWEKILDVKHLKWLQKGQNWSFWSLKRSFWPF